MTGGSAMTQAPQLRPLGAALGTEVLGIDLAKPLEAGTFAGIQAAFAEHPVLVFRDQDLGAPELAAFGRRFGAPRPHALTKYRHAHCPEVSWLTNVEETGKIDWYGVKRATAWHTDSTFEDALPLLAMLHAKEVPRRKAAPCSPTCALPTTPCPRHGNSCCPASPACTAGPLGPAASACMATTRARPTRSIRKCSGRRSRGIR